MPFIILNWKHFIWTNTLQRNIVLSRNISISPLIKSESFNSLFKNEEQITLFTAVQHSIVSIVYCFCFPHKDRIIFELKWKNNCHLVIEIKMLLQIYYVWRLWQWSSSRCFAGYVDSTYGKLMLSRCCWIEIPIIPGHYNSVLSHWQLPLFLSFLSWE